MKKLTVTLALALCSLTAFCQKQDTIIYRELTIYAPDGSRPYNYTVWEAHANGKPTMVDKGTCQQEIEPLGKLGAEGWHLVMQTTSISPLPNERDYLLEKTVTR